MKKIAYLFAILAVLATACGGEKNNAESVKEKFKKKAPKSVAEMEKEYQKYNGIGPIKAFEMPAEIDQTLVDQGKTIFEAKCTACHKTTKKFIGPSPANILNRRNPAWVMNMILNPDEMTQKDPLAKQLLIEYNGSPMANQNLSEEEARSVLEYFRTLE
ncbi:MAG: cytochrome c [Reichenbachiella sp.]|uniref:c-type cytochrome n=1 Tax=Reichenbachiella sp. TaxID=2184521 RepID=UPI0032651F4A